MKKIISLIFFFWFININAQEDNKSKQSINNITVSENSKGGNYKDILTSFFQIASTNFVGNNKTIEMNTTLFAIKAKANPELLTGNFEKERFSRNFQFNFKVNLDENFSYKGFTGGATYAIVNARDRRLAVLTKTLYGETFDNYRAIIETLQSELNESLMEGLSDEQSNIETRKLSKAIEDLSDGKTYDNNDNKYYEIVINKFKEIANKNPKFKHKDIKDCAIYLETLEKNEYNKIDSKLLWTLSIDGTSIEKGKFNKASIGTILLQGIKGSKCEIDFRSKLVYADTITITPMPRMDFNAKLAANFKLAKGANNVSFFETKIGMEYNSILKNILPDEKKDNFLGAAEIRIRLTNDLWLPLIIKYDIEKANFLGFLNVTYNFGSFKSKT